MTVGGCWGGLGRGMGVPRGGPGSGVCLGIPKSRDCARVSAEERLPSPRVVSEGVCSPRLEDLKLGDFG